ncbi:MAG TPA: glucans biosynthesis glucosyltransferase MdoH [Acetobacteraceae bacterium]|nr:glucans biosynthesis glucosyltransferase MdoH [Acetobacteraceae bacterium]
MAARCSLVVLIALLVGCGLGWLLLHVLAPGGWTLAKLVMLTAFIGTAPWTGLCAANALIGFIILMVSRDPVRAVCPLPMRPPRVLGRTAIVVTIRNEDMRRVMPPLRRLLTGLDLLGAGNAFGLFILSDTPAALAADEERAVAVFAAQDRDPSRICYRRRSTNTDFKAGNIMEFLDHRADGFEFMLALDADSEMSAEAVLHLLATIQAEPRLAIVQHLTVGLPASSAFPRLFQFGMRAGMRTWATGQAWWQGDEGPYWGHNAIVRIAPFRAHCRLPALPDGRPILSHDQIEAAVLRGAGWGVRVLPEEDGSREANPPALPEFLRRELRWLAGNMQYWHLLRLPGLRPMGRWQLIQAILLFAGTPLYLLFLLAAATAAATDPVSPFPSNWVLALSLAWPGALYSPKLLGYAEVMLMPAKLTRYGGPARFALGAGVEFAFALLMDAISAVAKTAALLRLALGAPAPWKPQNRNDRGVGWLEAARLLWLQTLFGVVVFAGFAQAGWEAVLWTAPFAGGLLLAIPFCVVTANARISRWMRDHGIAAIPEELDHAQTHVAVPVAALLTQEQAD